MDSGTGDRTPPLPRNDWALFLDVDGTLTMHAPRPEDVVLDARVTPLLQRLRTKLDGAVALVTGRSLQALDALLHPWVTPDAAGLHGLQCRPAPTGVAAPMVPAAWIAEAVEIAGRHANAVVEAHGPCLYLHWRAAPGAADAMTALAHRLVAAVPTHRLHPGAHGIEIRPHGMDKGKAILAFMGRPPFSGRIPVFAGDDSADEPGFEAVNALGGISVRVGACRPSAARYTLRDAHAVIAWLAAGGKENREETPRE